jgi:hypothetical protein
MMDQAALQAERERVVKWKGLARQPYIGSESGDT